VVFLQHARRASRLPIRHRCITTATLRRRRGRRCIRNTSLERLLLLLLLSSSSLLERALDSTAVAPVTTTTAEKVQLWQQPFFLRLKPSSLLFFRSLLTRLQIIFKEIVRKRHRARDAHPPHQPGQNISRKPRLHEPLQRVSTVSEQITRTLHARVIHLRVFQRPLPSRRRRRQRSLPGVGRRRSVRRALKHQPFQLGPFAGDG